jgi:hypothetical protein
MQELTPYWDLTLAILLLQQDLQVICTVSLSTWVAQLVISGGRAYMALQGSGNRQFRVRYDTAVDTMTSDGYGVFWGLILVFLVPLICGTITSLPFFRSATPEKKSRCTLILFVVGTLLGVMLFVLVLGKGIHL